MAGTPFTYLSVCSGIEAATVAWHRLGWTPWAFSELDSFPSAVLAHHYPQVRNLGDMTQWEEWPDATIDLLVGGTPCQSFSVAGKRGGMDDARGKLALAFSAIAGRYKPRWVVWENVPGVLSSGGGRDFGSFVQSLVELGYGVCWRVLDAQYVRTQRHPRAVPQRRRRVFLVGHLGSWQRAAAVLFVEQGLRRDTASRGKTRQKAAANAGDGTATSDRWPARVASTLNAAFGSKLGLEDQHVNEGAPLFVLSSGQGGSVINTLQDGTVGTLRREMHGHEPCVLAFPANLSATQHATTENLCPSMGAKNPTAVAIGTDCYNGAVTGDIAATMRTPGSSVNASGPTLMQAMPFDTTQITSPSNYSSPKPGDPCHPLAATAHVPAIASAMQVRRLTPRECERLQGFHDDYTLVPYRGKPAADGPRYKALGNSMAVNCMEWIGERIAAVEALS